MYRGHYYDMGMLLQVVVKTSEPLGANSIVITSYDLVSRRSDDLVNQKFKV